MSDVELRHLTAPAAVADEGSFGRAATRLGHSQSTVSQQIAALEKAVGGAVFDRPGGPRPVRITPLGAVVPAHGRDPLAKARTTAAAVDRFKAGDGWRRRSHAAVSAASPAPRRGRERPTRTLGCVS
jgi:DNA-binding transcriptional LysR family regulator